MKPLIISCLFLTATFHCFAQSNCNIKKAYAYYNVSMPGTQMVDENGNPIPPKPNITRLIYVEYSGTKMPDIKAVLYNSTSLSFSAVAITAKTISVGYKELNPNNKITAKKGNNLLEIRLQPEEGKTMAETGCRNIIIKSKQGSKLCKFYVTGEKEFFSLPNY